MKIIFSIKNKKFIEIYLKHGKKTLTEPRLTITSNFDILLITTLDKIVRSNKIERLSLKSVEIRGKMTFGAVSSVILKTTAKALNF
ncbi:MAG: hypothetical protein A3J46_05730 [Candidatus Yanofskybacteria bacterium RIFCSPHIGHO2_02_FULL_41_11]|uniref:Uncharacterized protein n=1 Tax=Candidatus Yanofskybacteria bacterium RIFCSPHIGHO2_02_FULL_41_11 TaxID=1802675 RepID=A0A1F8FBI4_9BACT|nr:MAG: hypothetical protein A3J46_05730 [Candidatus Yanofskybacteria bacterium RIFCSPHIGHO2_02_FULL_41_11]